MADADAAGTVVALPVPGPGRDGHRVARPEVVRHAAHVEPQRALDHLEALGLPLVDVGLRDDAAPGPDRIELEVRRRPSRPPSRSPRRVKPRACASSTVPGSSGMPAMLAPRVGPRQVGHSSPCRTSTCSTRRPCAASSPACARRSRGRRPRRPPATRSGPRSRELLADPGVAARALPGGRPGERDGRRDRPVAAVPRRRPLADAVLARRAAGRADAGPRPPRVGARRPLPRHAGRGDLRGRRRSRCASAARSAPGDFYALLPPADDIHRVRTTSPETSVSIHLLTNDTGCVWRHAYDAESGACRRSAPAT